MRKTTLILDSIAIIFFLGFLAYTFVAKHHLEGLARGFVTDKTLDYSRPIVDIAEQSLESPLIRKLVTDDRIDPIRAEIELYRQNPNGLRRFGIVVTFTVCLRETFLNLSK